METVRVIRDPETIKILSDLVRRQILRLLSYEQLTQSQIAKKIALSEPSVSHHLGLLLRHGLVEMVSTEVSPHGILQKYYAPTAKLFIEDWDSTPSEQRRYYVHSHLERLRGILSVLELLTEGQEMPLVSSDVEALAESTARRVSAIAERFGCEDPSTDREALLIKIYAETLREELEEGRWESLTRELRVALDKLRKLEPAKEQ